MAVIMPFWILTGVIVWAALLCMQVDFNGLETFVGKYDDSSDLAAALFRGLVLTVTFWPWAIYNNFNLIRVYVRKLKRML